MQSETYIKIRSFNIDAPQSRTDKDNEQNLLDLHSRYRQQGITLLPLSNPNWLVNNAVAEF